MDVGDKVIVASDPTPYRGHGFITRMNAYCGKIVTIKAIYPKSRSDPRQRVYHQRGKAFESQQHLAGDESTVYPSEGKPVQGISTQSAPPLCPYLLFFGTGHRATGGPVGPQQHQHHPHLHRGGRQRPPGQIGTGANAFDDIMQIM